MTHFEGHKRQKVFIIAISSWPKWLSRVSDPADCFHWERSSWYEQATSV